MISVMHIASYHLSSTGTKKVQASLNILRASCAYDYNISLNKNFDDFIDMNLIKIVLYITSVNTCLFTFLMKQISYHERKSRKLREMDYLFVDIAITQKAMLLSKLRVGSGGGAGLPVLVNKLGTPWGICFLHSFFNFKVTATCFHVI